MNTYLSAANAIGEIATTEFDGVATETGPHVVPPEKPRFETMMSPPAIEPYECAVRKVAPSDARAGGPPANPTGIGSTVSVCSLESPNCASSPAHWTLPPNSLPLTQVIPNTPDALARCGRCSNPGRDLMSCGAATEAPSADTTARNRSRV